VSCIPHIHENEVIINLINPVPVVQRAGQTSNGACVYNPLDGRNSVFCSGDACKVEWDMMCGVADFEGTISCS